ncbi:hypothetical protein EDEG_04022 [Edhazardia aedis USNM 41457]|uniref:Uncharacterized protein n=1 Tax=Edhazardia aedis (strain USNM 41457) TaxID=1003232 RepID=J9DIW4_EDHAE|nr:hypothetical protein EDEG_04022 [Edhazardia aedis USNM 41457]|eukprot:EJW01322.1 hypothetical protein EDEG_04022 [Edhazardia aedis USNM 41457]
MVITAKIFIHSIAFIYFIFNIVVSISLLYFERRSCIRNRPGIRLVYAKKICSYSSKDTNINMYEISNDTDYNNQKKNEAGLPYIRLANLFLKKRITPFLNEIHF